MSRLTRTRKVGVPALVCAAAMVVSPATSVSALSRGGGLGGSAAAVSSARSDAVMAVAGSSRFLVYTRFPRGPHGRKSNGQLFVRTSDGDVSLLGATSLDDQLFSIAGSTLFVASETTAAIRLWDLRTDKETTIVPPRDLQPIAAAPHGYLAEARSSRGMSLYQVSVSGHASRWVTPFPGKADGFAVRTGAGRYVVAEQAPGDRGGIKTASFTHPRHLTTLKTSRRDPGEAFCGSPDRAYVACRLEGGSLRLMPLDGQRPVTTAKHCNADFLPLPEVLRHSAVWVCGDTGRLWQLNTNGQTTRSKRRYAKSFGPVIATHEIIVSSHSRTTLYHLTSAASPPSRV